MDPLGGKAQLIAEALDEASLRHRIIGANIANLNTPGYKARTVAFDRFLERTVVKEREGVEPREDGNTVVMELEMADMRKNELIYRVYIQAMLHKAQQMRAAIQGRTG